MAKGWEELVGGFGFKFKNYIHTYIHTYIHIYIFGNLFFKVPNNHPF